MLKLLLLLCLTGCIAPEEDDFCRTLLWMHPHRRPHILITGIE